MEPLCTLVSAESRESSRRFNRPLSLKSPLSLEDLTGKSVALKSPFYEDMKTTSRVCFEGLIELPRPDACCLVTEGNKVFVAYKDYGLDRVTLPATAPLEKKVINSLHKNSSADCLFS